MRLSQSLSMPSHTSVAPGRTASLPSSQSVASATCPGGGSQATAVTDGSPKSSSSASRYQTSAQTVTCTTSSQVFPPSSVAVSVRTCGPAASPETTSSNAPAAVSDAAGTSTPATSLASCTP